MEAKEIVDPLRHLLEALKVDRNISRAVRQCAEDLLNQGSTSKPQRRGPQPSPKGGSGDGQDSGSGSI